MPIARDQPRKIHLTQEEIKKLQCPDGMKQVYFHDDEVKGLTVCATKAGSKTFTFYRKVPVDPLEPTGLKRPLRRLLGVYPDMNLKQARILAARANNRIVDKLPPFDDLATKATTFGELFNDYMNEYAKGRLATVQDTHDNYRRYFKDAWERKPLKTITRQDIQKWINRLAEEKGVHTANRSYDTMRAVFSWGSRTDRFEGENPCIGVSRFKTQARERFINPGDEWKRFLEALTQVPSETLRDFFWMSLLTAQRKANVLAMEWNHINLDLQQWRIPITKNGDSQTVSLTVAAMEILQRRAQSVDRHERWVFPSDRKGRKTGVLGHLASPKKAWARLLKEAKIDDLRIHDLRRTAGSYMAIQGVSPTIIGKALGHRSPQATAIYARLTQDPVLQALENAQAALGSPERLLRPNKNNVVELPIKAAKE